MEQPFASAGYILGSIVVFVLLFREIQLRLAQEPFLDDFFVILVWFNGTSDQNGLG